MHKLASTYDHRGVQFTVAENTLRDMTEKYGLDAMHMIERAIDDLFSIESASLGHSSSTFNVVFTSERTATSDAVHYHFEVRRVEQS